ncbi:MAG TPA: NAD-dependent epimerase/dehydratase family protein [Vicinamibacterales bacterium]|nr:NAD-dependent epimerase/dehydratase family protein [Vicinamibacterales bacterium]
MKALVTGVAGFVGSHLAERLVRDGAQVIGIDAFTDYYPRAQKERNLEGLNRSAGFTLVESSLMEADFSRLLDGVTHVFHLAAQAGVRKSWGREFGVYTINNIDATQTLLEACVGRTLERFVFASSSSVYGDTVALPMREDATPQPISPYGVTKLAAEQLCLLYHVNCGLPTVALRYFTVYGPRQRPDMGFRRFLAASMRNEPLPLYGDGRQTRDFTFVDDAVSATLAAASRATPGAVYNIGGGSRVGLLEVFERIARITGRPLRVDRLEAQRGDMRDTYADTRRACHDLGFTPTVTLEQGLRAQHEWMAEAGA